VSRRVMNSYLGSQSICAFGILKVGKLLVCASSQHTSNWERLCRCSNCSTMCLYWGSHKVTQTKFRHQSCSPRFGLSRRKSLAGDWCSAGS